MTRPKGSRNKPKENGIGHNGGEQMEDAPAAATTAELTDDEKQVIYFSGKRRIVDLKGQVAALNLEMRGEFKDLKLKLGLLRAEVEYGIMLDDEDAEEKHKRRMLVRRWEHPGEQAEMFGDGIDRTPAVDKAYAEGKKAGLAGAPCEPPHPGNPLYNNYMDGFHAGQAVLAQGIKRPDDFAERSAALAKEGQKLADEMFGKKEPWPDDAQIGSEVATSEPS